MRLKRKCRLEYRRFNRIDFCAPVVDSVFDEIEGLSKMGNLITKLSGRFANSNRAEICRELNEDLRAVEMQAAIAHGKIERTQDEIIYHECGFVWNGNIELEIP